MTFIRLSCLVLGAALLSSCASQWVNVAKTEEEFYRDRAACRQYESQREKRGSSRLQYGIDPPGDSFSATWSEGELEERRMKNKGWQRSKKE